MSCFFFAHFMLLRKFGMLKRISIIIPVLAELVSFCFAVGVFMLQDLWLIELHIYALAFLVQNNNFTFSFES